MTTAQLAADALGVEVGQIANSLVFTIDDEPILVLTSGAHRVDTDWLGEPTRRHHPPRLEGDRQGGHRPGHRRGRTRRAPAPVRTIVDVQLADYAEVWAAAGHAKTVFPTTFDELVRITGGTPSPVEPASSRREATA